MTDEQNSRDEGHAHPASLFHADTLVKQLRPRQKYISRILVAIGINIHKMSCVSRGTVASEVVHWALSKLFCYYFVGRKAMMMNVSRWVNITRGEPRNRILPFTWAEWKCEGSDNGYNAYGVTLAVPHRVPALLVLQRDLCWCYWHVLLYIKINLWIKATSAGP